MVYSSSEPQLVSFSTILKEEKTTLWHPIREADDDYAADKSSNVTEP